MDFAAYYGRSDRALWLDFIAKHRPSKALEQLVSWKQRRFLELLKREQPIFAGLPELVEKLSRQYKLAVASGSFQTAGVEAALAAGMKVIAITNSLPKSKLARATRVVSAYAEIGHLLLNRGWKE